MIQKFKPDPWPTVGLIAMVVGLAVTFGVLRGKNWRTAGVLLSVAAFIGPRL